MKRIGERAGTLAAAAALGLFAVAWGPVARAAEPEAAGGAAATGGAACAADVRRLARTYDLDLSAPEARTEGDTPAVPPSPPATEESRGAASGAARGGVIRPPTEGAPIAIPPPSTGPNSMPTAPPAQDTPKAGGGERAAGLDAARRSQLESLLLAADSAASRGDEAGCRARLGEARGIAGAGGG